MLVDLLERYLVIINCNNNIFADIIFALYEFLIRRRDNTFQEN